MQNVLGLFHRRDMRGFGGFALLLLLAGCVSSPSAPNIIANVANYEQVLAKTKLVSDPHAGWTSVKGPVIVQNRVRYMIRIRFDRRKADLDEQFQIQAAGLFPKRVYLGDVFSEGRKLKSEVLDRERIDCGYNCTIAETVGIALTGAQMDDYAKRGLTFEVIGRRDGMEVTIPASYFAAVLDFHRRHRGAPP